MIDKIIKNFPVLLLLSAIALCPSFLVGTLSTGKTIEIRWEDIILVILLVISAFQFLSKKRTKLEAPPLFYPILLLVIVGAISNLINWLTGILVLDRGFFYFLKEIELFIIYFYVYYKIKNYESGKFVTKFFIFLGLLNSAYVVYQAVTGHRIGEYGTGAIGEKGVFPTGAFFLYFFIFSINFLLYYCLKAKISIIYKTVLFFALLTPAMGIFGAASKTVFLAFALSCVATIVFYVIKEKDKKIILMALVAFAFMAGLFFYTLYNVQCVDRLLTMFDPGYIFPNYDRGRLYLIRPEIDNIVQNLSILPIGYGVGYMTEAHNQYVRNMAEIGIIGSIIFAIMILSFIRICFREYYHNKDNYSVAISAGLLVTVISIFFLSLATDPFFVVKPAEVFWVFSAIVMRNITLKKNEIAK